MSSHGGRSEWRVPIKRHVAQRTPHGVSHEHDSDPDFFVPSSNQNVTVPASTLWTPKPEADRIDNEIRLRVRVPAHLMAKYATMLAKRERPGAIKTKHMRKPSVKRDSVVSDDADVPVVIVARSSPSSLDWRLFRNNKIPQAEMEDRFLLRLLLAQASFDMNDMQSAFEGLSDLQSEEQWAILKPGNLIAATILHARAAMSVEEPATAAEHWTFALEMMAEHHPEEVDLKLLGYMGLAKAHELQQQPEQMLENYTAAVELAAHSEDPAVQAHAHAGMARAAAMIGDKQMASSSAELQLDFAADDSQIILSGLTVRGELQISEGKLNEATETFSEAAQLATSVKDSDSAVRAALAQAAAMQANKTDLTEVQRVLLRARRLCTSDEAVPLALHSELLAVLAMNYTASGDQAMAQKVVEQALALTNLRGTPHPMLLEALAQLDQQSVMREALAQLDKKS